MKFKINELEVLFPYDFIYPEQYQYMVSLKQLLDSGSGHGVLEMPSGTGKTITLLAFIIAYQLHHATSSTSGNKVRQLVYCSRTVQEIEKALAELHRLMEYRRQELGNDRADFLALGLASRKNLCINAEVVKERRNNLVDARCMDLTAPWVRESAGVTGDTEDGEGLSAGAELRRKKKQNNVKLCEYYETLESADALEIPNGVYTLEDMREYGRRNKMCPYFLSRRLLKQANVIIYNYHYLLDPKVAQVISRDLSRDSIIVFDEAHNIDNICIESMSIDITKPMLDASTRSLNSLSDSIHNIKQSGKERLEDEYRQLVEGLRDARQNRANETFLQNPVLPSDILEEAVPGNIRKAEHFVVFLRRFVEHLKNKLKIMHVISETPLSFLMNLRESTFIEQKPLRFCSERLASLVKTLEIRNLEDFSALGKIASFATLVSTYLEGFLLIMEPFESATSTVFNPKLHLCCLDASIAIKPVFKRYRTVLITSGTLTPLDMYPKILDFRSQVAITRSFQMTLTRQCFCPIVISRGSDQVSVSSKFEVRNDPAVVRNYGNMLIEFAKIVPDGIVAFFPSYIYMESIVTMWNDMRILENVLNYKLVFIETPDAAESSVALENYRLACDNGRGAVLLSVARGKVAEGIDFDHNYGRAVLMFGIPYQYTESRILKARLEYMRDKYQIRENDFLTFDAIRQAAQCVGRVIRGKTDYGLMIFADNRFARMDKRSKLPKWILANMNDANIAVSTDMAIVQAKRFLREMAQPYDLYKNVGSTLWSGEDIAKMNLHQSLVEDIEQDEDMTDNIMQIDT